MDKSIIIKLNQLNKQFYKITAKGFSDSRNYYWKGWYQILPTLQKLQKQKAGKIKVLDIGCGNGRFAQFLKENLLDDNFDYLGLDLSEELLKIATNNFEKIGAENIVFEKLDLIKSLLEDKKISENKFDLIVLFGVLHHVPGFSTRQKLFENLEKLLNFNGAVVATAWQFLDNPKLASRLVDPAQTNLNKKDLEKNDYILDWKRDLKKNSDMEKPLRYCHLATEEEMSELLENSKLEIIKKFKADSKTKNLNQYYVLEKRN